MQLLETIRTCNRNLENTAFHNERFNQSRKELFGIEEALDLKKLIKIPEQLPRSVHKCRVLYGPGIQQVEFFPYVPKKIKNIQLVEVDDLDYSYKFADRSHLQKLLADSPADEIIMVKNGHLTDASFANICFYDGEKWLTPTLPLLPGTMRAKLLSEEKIHLSEIRPSGLRFFKKLKLINAMLVFENTPALGINQIIN